MITLKYDNLTFDEEQKQGELMSWFLSNLSAGQFENITKDAARFQKLGQFFEEFVPDVQTKCLMLLVPSVELNKSPSFLIDLVSKFYDPEDTVKHDVSVTPIGTISALDATVVMISERLEGASVVNQDEDICSIISDDEGYIASTDQSPLEVQPEAIKVGDGLNSIIEDLNDISLNNTPYQNSLSGPRSSRETHVWYEDVTSPTSIASSVPVSQKYEVESAYSYTYMTQPALFPTKIEYARFDDRECVEKNEVLWLKSMLFKDHETGELLTAIRQSPGIEDIANGVDEVEDDDWLLYDEKYSLNNLQLLGMEDILTMQNRDPKILFYALEVNEILEDDPIEQNDQEDNLTDLSDIDDEGDLEVMEFQGNLFCHNTSATSPLVLSKTNTLNTFKSVRSELLVHNADGTYSNIVKSKSEPLRSAKVTKLHRNKKHLGRKTSCIVM